MSVLANDIIVLRDSNGGVGAKIASSPGCRIWRATSRERMFGSTSSPLFTSTHLTVMGGLPVFLLASSMAFLTHTPFDSKKSSSFLRAALTSVGVEDLARQIVTVDRLVVHLHLEQLVAETNLEDRGNLALLHAGVEHADEIVATLPVML